MKSTSESIISNYKQHYNTERAVLTSDSTVRCMFIYCIVTYVTDNLMYVAQNPHILSLKKLYTKRVESSSMATNSLSAVSVPRKQMVFCVGVAAVAFFLYLLCLLLNSFFADYRIYQAVAASVAERGFSFWEVYWLLCELVGEVGLIVRFCGACLFLAFVVLLLRGCLRLSLLRKSVLLEGLQYLFFIPFIGLELFSPTASHAYHLAAVSYVLQALLITPAFLVLYSKLRPPLLNRHIALPWIALCAVSFTFALWAKHFVFSFYALPADAANPLLLLGSVNSALTMLIGAALILFALAPLLKGSVTYHRRVLGAGLCCVGAYFPIYFAVAAFNGGYLSFVWLTEFWAVCLIVLGLGFLLQKEAMQKPIGDVVVCG
jgi:hypothetical protein